MPAVGFCNENKDCNRDVIVESFRKHLKELIDEEENPRRREEKMIVLEHLEGQFQKLRKTTTAGPAQLSSHDLQSAEEPVNGRGGRLRCRCRGGGCLQFGGRHHIFPSIGHSRRPWPWSGGGNADRLGRWRGRACGRGLPRGEEALGEEVL